jgi:hypothetical protein
MELRCLLNICSQCWQFPFGKKAEACRASFTFSFMIDLTTFKSPVFWPGLLFVVMRLICKNAQLGISVLDVAVSQVFYKKAQTPTGPCITCCNWLMVHTCPHCVAQLRCTLWGSASLLGVLTVPAAPWEYESTSQTMKRKGWEDWERKSIIVVLCRNSAWT